MTAFPAVAGTMLIDLDPAITPLPIIGWAHTTGLNVSPLVLGHPGPLVAGEAFLLHTEQVYDPGTGRFFGSAEDWRYSVAEEEPYRPGSVLALFTPPVEVRLPVVNSSIPAVAPKLPVAAKAPGGALAFDGKTYAKASFWKVEVGGETYVINMPPDHRAPTGPVEKITREVFFELRKSIPETTVEAILNPVSVAPPAEEPEAEDDDGDDLI